MPSDLLSLNGLVAFPFLTKLRCGFRNVEHVRVSRTANNERREPFRRPASGGGGFQGGGYGYARFLRMPVLAHVFERHCCKASCSPSIKD